jgi:hypothetical protein
MYVTVGQLMTHVGISNPTESDKVQLHGFIAAAQAIIERQTHRVFEAADDSVKYLDATCDVSGSLLWLPGDLCAITSITNGDGVAVAADDYVTEPRNLTPWYAIKLRSRSGLAWTYDGDPEDAIAVEGRWAYSINPPRDIQQATLQLAHWLYRQKDSVNDLDRPLMVGDGNVIMPAALPVAVAKMIHPYVRFRA